MKLVSISSEMKNLLDKLYNLRGDSSVILAKMTKERDEALATQERTKKEKEVLLAEIDKLTQDEAILAEQGNKLMSVLSSINRNDFATVLDRLKIDFEPATLNARVSKLLPETIDSVVAENKKASEKLATVEKEMNDAITIIEELEIRKEEALENQNRLNEYFDLALSGNINITRDAITSLLEKFDFTENEQREAAKILMFPEDALYEYDARMKSGDRFNGKSISEVIAEAKDSVEEKEENKQEIELTEIFDEIVQDANLADKIEPTLVANESDEKTEKNKLIDLLNSVNINPNQYTDKVLEKIMTNYDENTIKENVSVLKEKDMDLNILKDNYELLYDKELKAKLEKLIEIGKETKDICLMPSVLVKYNLKGLTNTINVLQISGLDPKKVPLMAY
ncbi:MAG: hypothetical protein E7172_06355 [Firmicutes bacterium]|nr:hypothetical protein [Bacillota bacterium]